MTPLPGTSHPFPQRLRGALCGIAAAFALLQCDNQEVAGTSVGTGNPTEIEVSFKNDSGAAVSISGTLDVYATTQIPVPGFSPRPLVSVPVTGASHATLNASSLSALAEKQWPETSVKSGLYHFNIVVTGENEGLVLNGFSFRKQDRSLVLSQGIIADTVERTLLMDAPLVSLAELQGDLDTSFLSPNWEYHLFIYGTGFSAKGQNGHFELPRVPRGKYVSHMLLLPIKDGPVSEEDSVSVQVVKPELIPEGRVLTLAGESALIPIPDSLKSK